MEVVLKYEYDRLIDEELSPSEVVRARGLTRTRRSRMPCGMIDHDNNYGVR